MIYFESVIGNKHEIMSALMIMGSVSCGEYSIIGFVTKKDGIHFLVLDRYNVICYIREDGQIGYPIGLKRSN